MPLLLRLLLAAVVVVVVVPVVVVLAAAAVPEEEISFAYPFFEERDLVDTLTRVVDADLDGDVISLTNPDESLSKGALWYNIPVLFRGMNTTFHMNITGGDYNDDGYEQGIAFVFHTDSTDSIGDLGAGMGYADSNNGESGIPYSFAIEFDCALNPVQNDFEYRHVSIHSQGKNPNLANEDDALDYCDNVIDICGKDVLINILYEPGTLSISMPEELPKPILIAQVDIEDYIDTSSTGKCYVGFTSSTGETGGASQTILSWSFDFLGRITASETSVTDPQDVSDAVAGEEEVFRIQGYDQYGNEMMYGGATFRIALSNGKDVVLETTSEDQEDGTYLVDYIWTVSGDYELSVQLNGSDISGSPFDVEIVAAAIDAAYSEICERVSEVVAGETDSVTLCAYDQYGNQIETGGEQSSITTTLEAVDDDSVQPDPPLVAYSGKNGEYSVSFEVEKAIPYILHVYVSGVEVQGSPVQFSTVAGEPDPTLCEVAGMLSTTTAGESFSVTIRTYDEFKNPLLDGGEDFVISLSPDDSGNTVGDVDDFHNGTYGVTFLMTKVAEDDESYEVSIALSTSPGKSEDVADSPYSLVVVPGPFSPLHSTLDGAGLAEGEAGVESSFSIQAMDEFENFITESTGAVITVTVVGDPSKNTTADVVDNEDGTYSVSYTITKSGDYMTYVLADGEFVGGKGPVRTTILPTTVSPSTSYVISDSDSYSFLESDIERTTWLQVQSADQYGNHLTQGGMTVDVSIIPESSKVDPIVATVVDNHNGTYTVTYTPDDSQKGTFTMSILLNSAHIKDSPFRITIHDYSKANAVAIGIGCGVIALCIIAVVGLLAYRRYKKKNEYQRLMESRE